jgi:hypothetical protein
MRQQRWRAERGKHSSIDGGGCCLVDHPRARADDPVRTGQDHPEQKNPINRALIWVYRPLIRGVLKAKTLTILARS